MVAKDAAYNSDSRYPMITWNYKSHSGTVPGNLYQTVTETVGDGNATIANTSTGGGTGVDFTELSAKIQAALAELGRSISIGLYSQGQTIADLVAEIIKLRQIQAQQPVLHKTMIKVKLKLIKKRLQLMLY